MHPIYVPPASITNVEKQEEEAIEEGGGEEAGESSGTSSNTAAVVESLPPELENFKQIPFPDMVEQQFEDTLRELPVKVPTVRNLQEAEALVENLEKRYALHLARLAAKDSAIKPSARAPGAMDTIVEDGEAASSIEGKRTLSHLTSATYFRVLMQILLM